MDERLSVVGQKQLMNLTSDDVPEVAHALVSLLVGSGRAGPTQVGGVAVVQLVGPDFDITLRGEDWLKIAPYLADGTLSLTEVGTDALIPDRPLATTRVEEQNPILFQRVYGILLSLFPTKYPTSSI